MITTEENCWEEELSKATLLARLADVDDPSIAYAYGIDDAFSDYLNDSGGDIDPARYADWKVSTKLLKATAFHRLRNHGIRESYDEGYRHGNTFDHSVLASMVQLGVIPQRYI